MNKKLFILFVSIFLSVNFVFAQDVTKYQNISKGLDNASTTEISNTSTLGLVGVARYIGMMAAAAIVTLVIFKLIEGAVLKGTYDNIYDQQKGNKIIQNAVISLLIFIFVNLLFTYINPDYGSWIFGASTSVDTSSSSPNIAGISSKCINDPKYISASFLDQIKQDEEDGKFAEKPYMDSLGYPTIGWGFNLDPSNEPKKYLTQVGIKDTQLTNLTSCKKGTEGSKALIGNCGSEKITKAQADQLLEIELKAHMPAVYRFAGGEAAFNKLPKNIQNVIMNLSYAGDALLTPGNKKYFKNLNTAINTTPLNYDNIAAEIIDSDWCKTTKSRCGRVVGLVYNGKCPTNSYTGIGSPSLGSQKSNNTSGSLSEFKKVVDCPQGTTDLGTVKTNYSGNPTIRLCEINNIPGTGYDTKGKATNHAVLNAVAAKQFYDLAEDAKKAGITLKANSSFRLADSGQYCAGGADGKGCAKAGTSNHQLGISIDFTIKCNGTSCGAPYYIKDTTCDKRAHSTDDVYKWLNKNSISRNIYQFSYEAWHYDAVSTNATRCTKP